MLLLVLLLSAAVIVNIIIIIVCALSFVALLDCYMIGDHFLLFSSSFIYYLSSFDLSFSYEFFFCTSFSLSLHKNVVHNSYVSNMNMLSACMLLYVINVENKLMCMCFGAHFC